MCLCSCLSFVFTRFDHHIIAPTGNLRIHRRLFIAAEVHQDIKYKLHIPGICIIVWIYLHVQTSHFAN